MNLFKQKVIMPILSYSVSFFENIWFCFEVLFPRCQLYVLFYRFSNTSHWFCGGISITSKSLVSKISIWCEVFSPFATSLLLNNFFILHSIFVHNSIRNLPSLTMILPYRDSNAIYGWRTPYINLLSSTMILSYLDSNAIYGTVAKIAFVINIFKPTTTLVTTKNFKFTRIVNNHSQHSENKNIM